MLVQLNSLVDSNHLVLRKKNYRHWEDVFNIGFDSYNL